MPDCCFTPLRAINTRCSFRSTSGNTRVSIHHDIFNRSPHGIVVLAPTADSHGQNSPSQWLISEVNAAAKELMGLGDSPLPTVPPKASSNEESPAWEAIATLLNNEHSSAQAVRFQADQPLCRLEVQQHGDLRVLYLYPQGGNARHAVIPEATPRLLELITESIPGYFFIKDKEFRLVIVNSRFTTLYPEEMRGGIVGTTTLESYDPVEREAFLAMDRKAFSEGMSEVEETITFPDGQIRTLLTKKIRFFAANGEPYILGLASDISAYKEAEQLIQQQNDQLTQQTTEAKKLADLAKSADQSKSLFLANMSHEMRTPLHGLRGMVDILKDSTLDPTQQEAVLNVDHCSEHLLTLVDDILDLAKVETGELAIDLDDTFAPEKLIQDIDRLLRPIAERKNIALNCNTEHPLPAMLTGDAHRIRQILINLTNNAIKFTEQGTVSVAAEYTNKQLTCTVTDTGPGIAADQLDNIFNAFTQLDTQKSKQAGGAGLRPSY